MQDNSDYENRISLEKTNLTVVLSKGIQKRLNLESFSVDLIGTPGLRIKTLQRNVKALKIIFKKDEQVCIRDDVLQGLRDERGYSLIGKTLGDSIWKDYISMSSSHADLQKRNSTEKRDRMPSKMLEDLASPPPKQLNLERNPFSSSSGSNSENHQSLHTGQSSNREITKGFNILLESEASELSESD